MNLKPTANLVLIAPEIPQNTGNVIRLCANVGARLHLVKPLGFELENPGLRRASLDYSDLTDILVHESIDEFLQTISINRVYAATTSGTIPYTAPQYKLGDTIVFGSESLGLPDSFVDTLKLENRVYIPMMPANRSLNLSNAAAIVVYEMWRQIHFHGSSDFQNRNPYYFS